MIFLDELQTKIYFNFSIKHNKFIFAQQRYDHLTLSRRRPISYRNQSIDLLWKSMDWFLYDIGLRREGVKKLLKCIQFAKYLLFVSYVHDIIASFSYLVTPPFRSINSLLFEIREAIKLSKSKKKVSLDRIKLTNFRKFCW